MRFEIIIPFFQREAGVLRQAIDSVLAQSESDWRLIIVDDGSPSPAEHDLRGLAAELNNGRILIIKKQNGGAGSARNVGLENVCQRTKFVAFLDSDDQWLPNHLERAANVLGEENDYFWSAAGQSEAFNSGGLPADYINEALLTPHPSEQDAFVSANLSRILTGQWWRHMHLSTSVLKAEFVSTIRFDSELSTCEDFDFYRKCAAAGAKVAISNRPSMTRGTGANIWHGTAHTAPKAAQNLLRVFQQLGLLRKIPGLQAADLELIRLRRERAREMFIWSQFARRKKGLSIDPRLIAKWIAADPYILLSALRLKFFPKGASIDPDEVDYHQTFAPAKQTANKAP